MEHLGKVFREFRTSGNYSLKEAAGESCSTSQLSRFELGESDLAVSRFFEILDNIHVTIENFMDKARNFHNHEHVIMLVISRLIQRRLLAKVLSFMSVIFSII